MTFYLPTDIFSLSTVESLILHYLSYVGLLYFFVIFVILLNSSFDK